MIHIQPGQVGIDEVGRGAWAGPMVAAAVSFPLKPAIPRNIPIRDSKLLTANARMRAFDFICKNAFYIVIDVGPLDIDRFGVHSAHKNLIAACVSNFIDKYEIHRKYSKMKMLRADDLLFYIDGTPMVDLPIKHIYQPHGDYTHKIISCASIVAKVCRDAYMKRMSQIYQNYGFERHAGYGTQIHQNALVAHGPCNIHRMSYRPLKKVIHRVC
ncbi:ribonuclease HII [Candidatus Uhrbacteria bacterium]|nr:ribonuclease HII [Candidatus Uhrbacteria bacterium]